MTAAEDHVRYLREFRVVDAVEVHSAPVEVGERHLVAYHEIRNPADGSVAATIRRRIVCDRPWPAAFRARAEAAGMALPEARQATQRRHARPARSHARQAPATGLIEVGRTVITPDECDEHG